MKQEIKQKIIERMFLVTAIWLFAEMAYDFYVFYYLEVNQGVWLSPFGVLSPLWFLPIGLMGLALGIWQLGLYIPAKCEEIEIPYFELPSNSPTETKCPQCGGEVNG